MWEVEFRVRSQASAGVPHVLHVLKPGVKLSGRWGPGRTFIWGAGDVQPLALVVVAVVVLREAERISSYLWHRQANVRDIHFV